MSSALAAAVSAESMITLKVNHDGISKRFKLPLRDLGISTLEPKLRGLLSIQPGKEALIERYSDSAGAYVALDSTNMPAYKQLYRAAKAKQKLKFRVTTSQPVAVEEKTGPKPASVEDEVEAEEKLPKLISFDEPEQPSPAPVQPVLPESVEQQQTSAAAMLSASMLERERLAVESRLDALVASFAAMKDIGSSPSPASPEPRAAPLPDSATISAPETEPASATPVTPAPAAPRRSNFAVICNSCDKTIPGPHYHCSTCDDGDFDLCQDCVDQGISCHGSEHWLIKRYIQSGDIVCSTTERIAPKPKAKPQPVQDLSTLLSPQVIASRVVPVLNSVLVEKRTCNSCVQEFVDSRFLHCSTCEDFDLCEDCFAKNQHGHHPKHAFSPVVEGAQFKSEVSRLLAPGRAQVHCAICDGCDQPIGGVRHKCMDCPDWDYCSSCVVDADFVHPKHRFVPIYEPLESLETIRERYINRSIHHGICCDGPLCMSKSSSSYITGDRFKCAVCHDTDFCANCEASPSNAHNRTHPLIKFKTPVRNVSVTTTGDQHNGQQMPIMGDRPRLRLTRTTSSRATETTKQGSVATPVKTVVDVQPSEPEPESVQPVKEEKAQGEEEKVTVAAIEKKPDFVAVFQRDTVADGTVMAPNHVFEQTWVLRNEGTASWPAGCSVKFVGGDYMGHVDPAHPASISDLVSASESTICYAPLAPGQEFPFTVLLRTPNRNGRVLSNWRLTTKDGIKFGHRLWCDVVVEKPKETRPSASVSSLKNEVESKAETTETTETTEIKETKEEANVAVEETEAHRSQMIFPKLEKESPVTSVHEEVPSEFATAEEYDECDQDDEWAEDDSQDGFLTDEEYDILDASDDEYLQEQQRKLHKK